MLRNELTRCALLFGTGMSSVAFEVALIRLLASRFGGTVQAVAVVVAVFLAALAAGAWYFGRRSDRSRRPFTTFVLLSALGGVAILAAPALIDLGMPVARAATGLIPGLPDAVPGLLLSALIGAGAAAFLLGGTLPVMASGSSVLSGDGAAGAGRLYAANTLGAVAGALLTGFVTLEALGTLATVRLAGAVALAVAVGTALLLRVSRSEGEVLDRGEGEADVEPVPTSVTWPSGGVIGLAALVGGFSTLGLEVAGTRLLMQYLQGSAHSAAAVLSVFLLGLAAGAALGAQWGRSRPVTSSDAARVRIALLCGGLCVATAVVGPGIQWIVGRLVTDHPIIDGIGAQLACALLLLPSTLASGALFAVLLDAPVAASRVGRHVGRLTVFNTVGSVLGSLGTAFVLLPRLGLESSLVLAAAAPLVVVLALILGSRRPLPLGMVAGGGAVALAGLFFVADLRAIPNDLYFTELVAYREGPVANVAVMESPSERRPVLFVNRTTRQGGGAGTHVVERRQGVLPVALMADRRPKSALVLGVGSGGTVASLVEVGVTNVHAVEIVDSVIDVLPLFGDTYGLDITRLPAVELFRDDAVAFTRENHLKYDLVIGDLFFPWIDGTGALYSVEHFRAVRERLEEGGLFCQWVPLHQLRWEDFGLLARTFQRVFPHVTLLLCDPGTRHPIVGLVGGEQPIRLVPAQLDQLFQSSPHADHFQELGLESAPDLLELILGDQYVIDAVFGATASLSGDDRLVNTLDRPVLEYRASVTTESEEVLALNNLNQIALRLGANIDDFIEYDDDRSLEDQSEYSLMARKRSSALREYLIGHYWLLRAQLHPEDVVGDEQREAENYLQGLVYDPTHPALNRAAADLTTRRLAARRYQQVIGFASTVLGQNPDNVMVARNLGVAYLLLGESESAIPVLEHATGLEPDDPYHFTVLGIAQYDAGLVDEARESLRRADELNREQASRLAVAIAAAIDGEIDQAHRFLDPMLEHPIWGSVARRAKERFGAP